MTLPDRPDRTPRPESPTATPHSLPGPSAAAAAAAVECVFRSAYRDLHTTVYRIVRSHAIAEEIIQDTVLAALERYATARYAHLDVRRYLFKSARNRALNHVRREQVVRRWRERAGSEDWDGRLHTPMTELEAAEEEAEHQAAVAELREAIERLPKRLRYTLLLRIERKLSNSEIADAMQISLKGVENNITRSLKVLRTVLNSQSQCDVERGRNAAH